MVLHENFIFGFLLHSYFDYSSVHFAALHANTCAQIDRSIDGYMCKCVLPSTTFIFLMSCFRSERSRDVVNHHRRFPSTTFIFAPFKILSIYAPCLDHTFLQCSQQLLPSTSHLTQERSTCCRFFITFSVFAASFRFLSGVRTQT